MAVVVNEDGSLTVTAPHTEVLDAAASQLYTTIQNELRACPVFMMGAHCDNCEKRKHILNLLNAFGRSIKSARKSDTNTDAAKRLAADILKGITK